MTKHARVLLPALAALVLVAVPVAQAKPVHAAATITVTAGKPAEFNFKLSSKTVAHGAVLLRQALVASLPVVDTKRSAAWACPPAPTTSAVITAAPRAFRTLI